MKVLVFIFFFFPPVFQQGNLKGKDISLYLTLVFGTLVWRQGCFSGDSGSLFQSLPCLFAGDIKLKSNLEWKKGQKKTLKLKGQPGKNGVRKMQLP